jgi:formylglycine-generating enzyme required for sulfatase activity
MEWCWAAMGADYYNSGQINRKGWNYTYAGQAIGKARTDNAWCSDNSSGTYKEVGLLEPNELGLYDMSGNIAEWCWDWYNNTQGYSVTGTTTNYTGPANGNAKMNRGGSYLGPIQAAFLNWRGGGGYTITPYMSPTDEPQHVGMRLLCVDK